MARAPRVHAVLTFLVSELLAGRAESINEQRISEGAFGSSGSYNSSENNLVRVTVGNLRSRLEEFYGAEGAREPWIFEIPKGRYVPAVRPRDAPVETARATPAVANPPPAIEARGRGWRGMAVPVVVILAASNILFACLLLVRRDATKPPPKGLLPLLFRGRTTPVTVVVTDEHLMAVRGIFGKTVLLPSYIDRSYAAPTQSSSPVEDRVQNFVRLREATSTMSATVAVSLQAAFEPFGVRVRHPAEISTPDFEHDSIILLGGPWVNPWVQLFEDSLDFRTFAPPGGAPSEIHVAHVKPGERAVYAAGTKNGIEVSYLRVAVQPNLSRKGKVILIGGIKGASQEAGCNFLLDPARVDEILQRFGVSDVAHLPPFELLFEVRGVARTPLDLRIVAARPYGAR